MKKILVFVPFVLFSSFAVSQPYSYDEIITRADNILHSYLEQHLFQYITLSERSSYVVIKNSGRQVNKKLKVNKNIQTRVSEISIEYLFNYQLDSTYYFSKDLYFLGLIQNRIEIVLNNKLELLNQPNFDLIPTWLLTGQKCNFLNKYEIINTLHKQYPNDSVQIKLLYLWDDSVPHKYNWNVCVDNFIKEKQNEGNSLILEYDAISGEFKGKYIFY